MPIWGWSLTLAVTAIGTRFVGLVDLTSHGEEICAVLHELLLKEVGIPTCQFFLLLSRICSFILVGCKIHSPTC